MNRLSKPMHTETRPTFVQKVFAAIYQGIVFTFFILFYLLYAILGPGILIQESYQYRDTEVFQEFFRIWGPKGIRAAAVLLVLFLISLLVRRRRKRNWVRFVDYIEELANENRELRSALRAHRIPVD